MDGPVRAYPARRRGVFARAAASQTGPVGAYPVRQRRPNRMRGLGSMPRWVAGLAALLVLVIVLSTAAIADTVVRFRVQGQIAAALDDALSCSPRVTMGGLSAIWQVRQKRFHDVRVRCDRAQVDRAEGDPITLTNLSLDGRDIRAAADIGDAVMGSATLSALLPYDQASTLLGSKVGSGGPGRIAVTRSVAISGVPVPVTYSVAIGVAEGKLVLSDPKAQAVGVPIPQVVVDQITAQILQRAALPTVGTMTVSSIVPLDGGLMVTLYGTDVRLSELR